MAKQIKEFTAHDITGNDDALLFQTSGGTTYKVLWSQIISKIINDHITNGSNITLTRTGNVLTISTTGGGSTYSPGDGIDITNNAISVKLGEGLTLNATTGNIDVTGGGTGQDGYSISAAISTITGGHRVTIHSTDPTVTDTSFDVMDGTDGNDGDDGYSISATVTTITGGHRVTIHNTDPNVSDTSFDVMDGNAGGYSGISGITVAGSDISFNVGSGLQVNSNTGNVDVVGKQSQITTSAILTLVAANWNSTTKQQTVTFAHDPTKRNIIDITPSEIPAWGECGVYAVSETASGITFECSNIPSTALTFKVTSMEVV